MGPKMEPWGTPQISRDKVERTSLKEQGNLLSETAGAI